MESQEKKSKWDELARELGATTPPEAQSASPPPATGAKTGREASPPARSKPSPDRPPERPKPTAKNWDTLAADLGIQPAPPPPAAARAAESRSTAMSSIDASGRSESPRASRETAAPKAPAPDDAAAPEPKPAGGVSLWHKIFGSPEQQAQRIVESRRPSETAGDQADEGSRDDRLAREVDDASRSRREPVERGVRDEWSGTEASADELPSAGDGMGDERSQPVREGGESRRRRPRRRRRGRGRRQEGDAAAPAEGTGRREASVRRHEGRSPAKRPMADPDIEFEDEMDDFESDQDTAGDAELDATSGAAADADGKGTSPRHRSIPAWEEAIGMIVDANMRSRSERRRAAPPKSSPSGASRGRARGRRRKKE